MLLSIADASVSEVQVAFTEYWVSAVYWVSAGYRGRAVYWVSAVLISGV